MDSQQFSLNFAATTSIEPFNRLVKLAARAFFDDDSSQPLAGGGGGVNPVVVLDALTRRHWVREDDFAKDLKLFPKQLRRTLKLLEEHKFITQVHCRERVKVYGVGAGEENSRVKVHTHSCCCLDYSQIHDVLRYRIHGMRKSLRKDKGETVQEYQCPNCHSKYTALDAIKLISMVDCLFHCQLCDGELEVAESEKPTHVSEDMLEKMEAQLKPLTEQLMRVNDLPVPDFVDLQAWEAQARANAASGSGDFRGNEVEVAFHGLEVKGENVQFEERTKVLPPWMIKEGMNLTKEQRGEAGEDTKPTISYADDKKSAAEDDKEKILKVKEEYCKSYYAAILKRQHKLEALKASDSFYGADERQVGIKSKREDDDEDDDLDWEEG